ncbi:hypothetical protein BH09ACT8_BH09ACT8_18530 [soil metagenome]
MTYRPDDPGPPGPQYPFSYGLTFPDPAIGPQTPPPQQTNKMATWSIVFAFLFAPIGAVLGHFALADIRDRHQRGRDRAMLGLTLSYGFTVIAIGALVVWAIRPANPVTASATAPTAASSAPATTETQTPTARPIPTGPSLSQANLPQLLLTLDEIKAITKTPNLAPVDYSPGSGSGGSSGSGGKPDPTPPCFDVITAGMDTDYDGTGYTGYKGAHFLDPTTATIVDEVASTFADAAAAQRFVGHVADMWSGCSGQTVTLPTPPGSPTVALIIGNVTATTDGATLQNTLAGKSFTQYRALALKGNVVVDLGAMGLQLTPDQPQAMQDQILARIPG